MQAKKRQEPDDAEVSLDGEFKKPKDWRERKAQRQRHWSVSQGFRFGRKLGEWGEEPASRGAAGGREGADGDEDAQMQEAIRRSLVDATGAHCCFRSLPQGLAGMLTEKVVPNQTTNMCKS